MSCKLATPVSIPGNILLVPSSLLCGYSGLSDQGQHNTQPVNTRYSHTDHNSDLGRGSSFDLLIFLKVLISPDKELHPCPSVNYYQSKCLSHICRPVEWPLALPLQPSFSQS